MTVSCPVSKVNKVSSILRRPSPSLSVWHRETQIVELPVDSFSLLLSLFRFYGYSECLGVRQRKREREIEVEGVCEGVEKSIPFQRKTPSRLFRVSLLFLKHSGFFSLFSHNQAHPQTQCVTNRDTKRSGKHLLNVQYLLMNFKVRAIPLPTLSCT